MLDSDGTYHPEEIPMLISAIPKDGIAIGDRLRGRLEPKAMTSVNWIGNQLLTWLAVALHGKPINDLCSGFWAFSRAAVEKMKLNSMRLKLRLKCTHPQHIRIYQWNISLLLTPKEKEKQNLAR